MFECLNMFEFDVLFDVRQEVFGCSKMLCQVLAIIVYAGVFIERDRRCV